MSSAFEGKGFLVAGGAAGFGRGIVAAAAARGAVVVFSGRPGTDPEASALLDELRSGGAEAHAHYCPADVSREEDVDRLFEAAAGRLPGLHVVVTADDASPWRSALADSPLAAWDAILASSLRACFLVARRGIEEFLAAGEGGRIVHVAPPLRQGAHGQAGPAALQGAIASLTRSIAKEYGGRGIACNAVAPILGRPPAPAGPSAGVVEAVLFLASTEASYVNGETLRVAAVP